MPSAAELVGHIVCKYKPRLSQIHHVMLCVMINVLYKKVGAQCDKMLYFSEVLSTNYSKYVITN